MKFDIRKEVGLAVLLGLTITVIALIVLPLRGKWLVYDGSSAAVGSTFGGIAGPFLSLTGLALVYFTFHEQFKANEQQREQRNYDSTYQLLDKLLNLLASEPNLFAELPKLEFANRLGFKVDDGVDKELLPLGFSALTLRRNQLRQLKSYFDLIQSRVSQLLPAQKQVIVEILASAYLHWLEACYDSYAYHFSGANVDPNTVTVDMMRPAMKNAESLEQVAQQIAALKKLKSGLASY